MSLTRGISATNAASTWSRSEAEFMKRAGFALMAGLAWHDRKTLDRRFVSLLRQIEKGSDDNRNFIRKAVSWALRQTGKRNAALRLEAIAAAERILVRGTPAARWIARDALREFTFHKHAKSKRASASGVILGRRTSDT